MHRHRTACRALLGGLLFAGCAHLPEAGNLRDRHAARSIPAARSPAVEATGTPEPGTAAGANGLPDEPSRDRAASAPVDLFDRMRSGFALPPVEALAVRRQID